MSHSSLQMNAAVVPPPVSAPERATTRNPKLNLPAPSVIAPPPSADVSHDINRVASGSIPDSSKTVVPPPPTQTASGSFMSSLMGKIFGASRSCAASSIRSCEQRKRCNRKLTCRQYRSASARDRREPRLEAVRTARATAWAPLGPNVVAPPPSIGVSASPARAPFRLPHSNAGHAERRSTSAFAPRGRRSGTGLSGGGAGIRASTLLANNIVPPPPSVGGSSVLREAPA